MQMEQIEKFIANANDDDIIKMIALIIERQEEIHPDWIGMYLSFPLTNPIECKRIIEAACNILTVSMKQASEPLNFDECLRSVDECF